MTLCLTKLTTPIINTKRPMMTTTKSTTALTTNTMMRNTITLCLPVSSRMNRLG